MNILMLNYEFPPIGGGAGQAHLAILKQYASKPGLRVDVLASAPKPGFEVRKLSDNVTLYTVGVHKKNLHYWRKIEVVEWVLRAKPPYQRLLKANRYDLVHAFFGLPTGWLCYKTANRLPYIISLRGSDVPGGHARLQLEYKLLGPLLKRIWTGASALVACSKGLKARSQRFLSSANIDVIPNGVDLEKFHPASNKELSGEFKLLTVGRLSVTKRFEMLVDTVDILKKQGKNIRLTISGGGGLLDDLKNLVEQKKLADVVNLTGRIESEKMPGVYGNHDMFVSATMQEGMSNAMLEAMASGLPIITTKCEGTEELISDNGIVVENDSAESLAEAIIGLAGNQQQYKTMCAAARRKAQTFGWDCVADGYIKLYQRVLNNK
jgi:glycosyltransferase involved in cell wall biosynthesis